jgi:hypothetical protein
MKKVMSVGVLILMALLLLSPQPADAHGPGRVHFGASLFVGPGHWWPGAWWGPGWWGPRYLYPPPVVVRQAPVYVQPARPPEEPYYWYYCQKPQGYYPYIQRCPNGWMKVVPPASPPGR